jgi:Family of unknown function (DUF6085)
MTDDQTRIRGRVDGPASEIQIPAGDQFHRLDPSKPNWVWLNVAGNCPMGCGPTLLLGPDGQIACSLIGCTRPDAAAEILGDRETEHLVDLGEKTFAILHPLRERLDNEVLACQLHHWLYSLDGPPHEPGRYRVTRTGDGTWPTFTRLDTQATSA